MSYSTYYLRSCSIFLSLRYASILFFANLKAKSKIASIIKKMMAIVSSRVVIDPSYLVCSCKGVTESLSGSIGVVISIDGSYSYSIAYSGSSLVSC